MCSTLYHVVSFISHSIAAQQWAKILSCQILTTKIPYQNPRKVRQHYSPWLCCVAFLLLYLLPRTSSASLSISTRSTDLGGRAAAAVEAAVVVEAALYRVKGGGHRHHHQHQQQQNTEQHPARSAQTSRALLLAVADNGPGQKFSGGNGTSNSETLNCLAVVRTFNFITRSVCEEFAAPCFL